MVSNTRRFAHTTYPKHVTVFRDGRLMHDECTDTDGKPIKQPMKWTLEDAESYLLSGVWEELFEVIPAPPGSDIPQMEVDAW